VERKIALIAMWSDFESKKQKVVLMEINNEQLANT